jgi:6-phosphogluconolactonase (cycloisomerase 2 family)
MSTRRAFLGSVASLPVLAALDTKSRSRWVVHPNRQVAYGLREVSEYQHLPRGAVDAYRIESGGQTLLGTQPLSLSAIMPRSIAISPDGRYLVVAVYGGGSYNVLSISKDGELEPVCGIYKEIGCGLCPVRQASAHPHTVVFDQTGDYVLSSDFGCDTLSVFKLDHGHLVRRSRLSLAPGSGPGLLTLDVAKSVIEVRHELRPAVTYHRYDASAGIIEPQFRLLAV